MEKLGCPGPWSPPYDPTPQMPKNPIGSGGQVGTTQAVLFPGNPKPLVLLHWSLLMAVELHGMVVVTPFS